MSHCFWHFLTFDAGVIMTFGNAAFMGLSHTVSRIFAQTGVRIMFQPAILPLWECKPIDEVVSGSKQSLTQKMLWV